MQKRHHEDIEILSSYREDTNEIKLISLWFLGTIFVFIASWIAGHVEWVYGTTPFSFWFSIILSFVLFMAGSFLWMVVAVIVAQSR